MCCYGGKFKTRLMNQHWNKGVNKRSKYVTQVQQQRPESPTVTLTWHACKYKVHKLHSTDKLSQQNRCLADIQSVVGSSRSVNSRYSLQRILQAVWTLNVNQRRWRSYPVYALLVLFLFCFTSTEASWPIRDGDRVGRGRESEGLDRKPPEKDRRDRGPPPEQWEC